WWRWRRGSIGAPGLATGRPEAGRGRTGKRRIQQEERAAGSLGERAGC
ncbi:MAG: hypothetical protein AVDCRST_MAG31-1226, partial [uncultured Sphingomonas sp.]